MEGCQSLSSWCSSHGIAGDAVALPGSAQALALLTPVNNPAVNRVRTAARRNAQTLDRICFRIRVISFSPLSLVLRLGSRILHSLLAHRRILQLTVMLRGKMPQNDENQQQTSVYF